MPKRDELPTSIASLADINALVVRSEPDFENDMRRLREAMVAYDPSLLEFHAPWVPPTKPPLPPAGTWARLFKRRRARS